MTVSRERLLAESAGTGFAPAMLEKVIRLLGVLDLVNRHPRLAGKLALKGGTALNLFFFDLPPGGAYGTDDVGRPRRGVVPPPLRERPRPGGQSQGRPELHVPRAALGPGPASVARDRLL